MTIRGPSPARRGPSPSCRWRRGSAAPGRTGALAVHPQPPAGAVALQPVGGPAPAFLQRLPDRGRSRARLGRQGRFLQSRRLDGYLPPATFFVKRFKFNPDKTYPDRNSNAQVYCRDEFVELESLGPLDAIDPGQEVTHTETWEIHPAAGFAQDIAGIRELVKSIQQE